MNNRVTRRELLKMGASVAAAGTVNKLVRAGQSHEMPTALRDEADVPDTLLGAADPKFNYESPEGAHLDQRPPYLCFRRGGDCIQENLHPIPMMPVMSGSTQGRDLDHKMIEVVVRDMDEKGLWWLKTEGAPWRGETYGQDLVEISCTGRMIVAFLDWHKYDPAAGWDKQAGRMAEGLTEILQKDAKGMYYSYYTRSGWKAHNKALYPMGLALWGLARWYGYRGDERTRAKAAELAELAEFMLEPWIWNPSEGPSMVAAAELGHWEGHFHTHAMPMIGMLEYALTVNDSRLAEFVAQFYEYSRDLGIARIGFFISSIEPLSKNRERENRAPFVGSGAPDEGCDVADMVILAAMLCESGIGDYWDDVDQYVRNHLIERQVLRRDWAEEIVAAGPDKKLDLRMETADNVVDRCMRMFPSICDPTMSVGLWYTMCCMGNCSTALYKAWQSTLRHEGGTVQVNLPLNRASAWMDVDSYLPYDGKVVLKNKAAKRAFLRIPKWVDHKAVRCRVNQMDIPLRWLGNYLIVDALAPRDTVTADFPLLETTEKHTSPAYGIEYTCRFRGNTLVDISPRAEHPSRTLGISDDRSVFAIHKGYQMYQERNIFRQATAPQKRPRRYTSPVLI